MRVVLAALAALFFSSTGDCGVYLSADSEDGGHTGEFFVGSEPDAKLRINISLVNSDDGTTELSSAQVALAVRALPSATTSSLDITLVEGLGSLFGLPAIDAAANVEGVTTPQAASPFTLVALGPGSRAVLAAIDIQPPPGAKGRFGLIALALNPNERQTSSEWRAAAIPPVFPPPMPYMNDTLPGSDEILLGVITVVPEPSCALLLITGVGVLSARKPRFVVRG